MSTAATEAVETAVLGLPVIKSGFADAVLANQLCDLHAGLRLLQNRNDLLFTESGLLRQSSPVGKLYSRMVLIVRGLHVHGSDRGADASAPDIFARFYAQP